MPFRTVLAYELVQCLQLQTDPQSVWIVRSASSR